MAAQAKDRINYIRNSVKATVDAYDGTVRLYAWDPTDPVLKTWMKAFPGTVQPRSADPAEPAGTPPLPRGPVQGPARHPLPLPRAEPQAFYGGQDFWQIPNDPTGEGNASNRRTT